MAWQSVLAIYLLFWVFSAFLVLPFFARTSEEAGEATLPGHAESAPHRFSFARAAGWTTLVSALLFGAFYLNYVFGWVGPDAVNLWR